MDHTMMHLHQHHRSLELEERSSNRRDAAMPTGSASVSVSQVAFALAAVSFLSLFSSLSSSSLPSGAALYADARQLLAALCGFVTTKQALFLLSNAIFLFLAADCRCFFPGVCGMATSTSDDVVTPSEPPPCAVQVEVLPCGSYPRSHYCCSNTKSASADRSGGQGLKQEEMPVSSLPESIIFTLETETVVVEEPTCHGRGVAEEAQEELEKLEMDELNRKFEDFIQSRRIKWLKEEEEVLQCQHQQVV